MGSDDAEPRYKGSIDVPLSPKGKAQVKATSSFMESKGMRPDAVYCSTLSRARVSAEILCNAFDGLSPVEVTEFKERHFGRWEGMNFSEIGEAFPDDFSAWARDPLNFSPIEGESTLEVRDRVMPKLDEVLNSHDGGAVALVAHGGVNRVILCELMGLSLEHIFRIEQDNACLNIVRFYPSYGSSSGSSNKDYLPVVKLLNTTHWTGATGPI